MQPARQSTSTTVRRVRLIPFLLVVGELAGKGLANQDGSWGNQCIYGYIGRDGGLCSRRYRRFRRSIGGLDEYLGIGRYGGRYHYDDCGRRGSNRGPGGYIEYLPAVQAGGAAQTIGTLEVGNRNPIDLADMEERIARLDDINNPGIRRATRHRGTDGKRGYGHLRWGWGWCRGLRR